MKRLALCLLALSALLLPFGALAQSMPNPACPLSAGATVASFTATTQIIAAPAAGSHTVYISGVPTVINSPAAIHICKVELRVNQTSSAADYGLIAGTGSNCATSPVNVTPQWKGTISVIEKWEPLYGSSPVAAPAGKAVCVKLSAAPTGALVLMEYGIY